MARVFRGGLLDGGGSGTAEVPVKGNVSEDAGVLRTRFAAADAALQYMVLTALQPRSGRSGGGRGGIITDAEAERLLLSWFEGPCEGDGLVAVLTLARVRGGLTDFAKDRGDPVSSRSSACAFDAALTAVELFEGLAYERGIWRLSSPKGEGGRGQAG